MVTEAMLDPSKFALFSSWRRVWAIGSIHGDGEKLAELRRRIVYKFGYRDRAVFLGNYLGAGGAIIRTLDELLALRSELLSFPGMEAGDVVMLRGNQEEMWHKLLQLQFAFDPRVVLDWMVDRGIDETIRSYGSTTQDGIDAIHGGTHAISRWTSTLRRAMEHHPGHTDVLNNLKRACVTDNGALLFVHCGLDPERPLEAQSDDFWWNHRALASMSERYLEFSTVVRGFDPDDRGFEDGVFRMTLDGGCGRGGDLIAACFDREGQIVDMIRI